MGKTYSRVQRGQVYWFDPIQAYGEHNTFIGFNGREYKSSVQLNHRPWLVVSNNEGNSSSPTCNIVPITLEEKAHLPVHVYFSYEGRKQTILVEQMRTVDCLSLSEYIYTLSDSVMEQVEKALAIQYDIRPAVTYADFTLDSTISHLEKVIANIIANKVELAKQEWQKEQPPVGAIPVSQVEEAAIHLGQMIEDLVEEVKQPMPQPTKPTPNQPPKAQTKLREPKKPQTSEDKQSNKKTNYSGMSAIEKFNARYGRTETTSTTTVQPSTPAQTEKPKRKRNTWTTEAKLQYLRDCDELSPQQVQQKYGFKSVQSVFQMKYMHKNSLVNIGLIKNED